MDARCTPGTSAGRLSRYLLGTDDAGPRHAVGDPLRPAHLALSSASSSAVIACTIGASVGVARGLCRRPRRERRDAHRRPAALLPRDPDRARAARRCSGKGVDKVDHRAGRRAMGLLRPHGARHRRWSSGGANISRPRAASPLPKTRIVFRHLLPNCLPPLIVVATVQVAHAIALEATLSFLGVGVPVDRALARHADRQRLRLHAVRASTGSRSIPGIALVVAIVAINLVGDRLRDVLNPRLER